jgi:hypothetical protein
VFSKFCVQEIFVFSKFCVQEIFVFSKFCVQEILCSGNFCPENRAVGEIMWKNMVQLDRSRMAVYYGACGWRAG